MFHNQEIRNELANYQLPTTLGWFKWISKLMPRIWYFYSLSYMCWQNNLEAISMPTLGILFLYSNTTFSCIVNMRVPINLWGPIHAHNLAFCGHQITLGWFKWISKLMPRIWYFCSLSYMCWQNNLEAISMPSLGILFAK